MVSKTNKVVMSVGAGILLIVALLGTNYYILFNNNDIYTHSIGVTTVDDDHSHKYYVDEKGDGWTDIVDYHAHQLSEWDVGLGDGHIHTVNREQAEEDFSTRAEEGDLCGVTGAPQECPIEG